MSENLQQSIADVQYNSKIAYDQQQLALINLKTRCNEIDATLCGTKNVLGKLDTIMTTEDGKQLQNWAVAQLALKCNTKDTQISLDMVRLHWTTTFSINYYSTAYCLCR